ncbi:MAG TPA: HWE histidine kinase domain-containing protein, partial [Beijerinckiaceae bacterium]
LTPQAPIYRVEYRYMRPDGGIVWLESSGYGEFDDEGRLARVTGFTTDVTARKDAQTRQDLLVRELHHRVKNNLATVLAVANLSGRGATSLEDYKKRLRARIQSMARSHTLLTESAFQRASLAAVLRNELEAYADPEEGRVTLEGAEVEVSPESAIGLGMAFHELATNAGKYGALSHESGRLDVRWGVETGAGERTLRLRWIESGGPAVSRPNRLGFGTRLLENVIAGQLGGRIEMRYEPGGLEVEIVAPMGRFAAQTREPDPAGA